MDAVYKQQSHKGLLLHPSAVTVKSLELPDEVKWFMAFKGTYPSRKYGRPVRHAREQNSVVSQI